MTVKEWLEKMKNWNKLILSATNDIKETQKFVGMADEALITKTISSIENEIDELFKYRIDVQNVINSVEDYEQRLVLRYRYILFYTWEDIERIMGLSHRQIFRIHKKAINAIETNFPNKFLEEGEKDESKH